MYFNTFVTIQGTPSASEPSTAEASSVEDPAPTTESNFPIEDVTTMGNHSTTVGKATLTILTSWGSIRGLSLN